MPVLIAGAGCRWHDTAPCNRESPDDLRELLADIEPIDGVYLDQWQVIRYGEEPPVILTRTSIYPASGLVVFRECELIRSQEVNIYVDLFTQSGEYVESRVWLGEEDGEGEWYIRSFPERENWVVLAGGQRRVRPFKAPADGLHESWLPLLIRYHQRRGSERFSVVLARNYGISDSAERIVANRLGTERIQQDGEEVSVDVWVADIQFIHENHEPQRIAEYWYVRQSGSILATLMPGGKGEYGTSVSTGEIPHALLPPDLFYDLKAIGGELPKPK